MKYYPVVTVNNPFLYDKMKLSRIVPVVINFYIVVLPVNVSVLIVCFKYEAKLTNKRGAFDVFLFNTK